MKILAHQRLTSYTQTNHLVDKHHHSAEEATELLRTIEKRTRSNKAKIKLQDAQPGDGYVGRVDYEGNVYGTIGITAINTNLWEMDVEIDPYEDVGVDFYVTGRDIKELWRKAKAELRKQTTTSDFKNSASPSALKLVQELMRI